MDEINILNSDPRPSRSDAVKNRELLLDTANRLFNAHGVESVTMSQIAQEAHVGKGTLYRHFKDKTELCYALLDQEMRDLQNSTLRMLRQEAEPCVALRQFLENAARFVARNDDLLSAGDDGGTRTFIQHPAHLWWRHTIRGLLAQLNPAIELDYATDVLYIMLDVNAIRFQRRHLGYDLPRIIAGLNATLDRLRR